jgi:gas vesicle protein
MRSRTVCNASSMMGLAVGVAAGLAAGLLAAPMRGTDMRANLRSRAADGSARLQTLASSSRDWAQHAIERATLLVEEGRRAFNTGDTSLSEPAPLTASLGEIAQFHSGGEPISYEGRV